MPLHLAEKTGTLTLHFQPHPDSEGKPGKARALVLEVEAAECERPEGSGSPQILAFTFETLERLLGIPLHLQIDPDRRILYVYVQRPATVNGPGTMEEDAAEFEQRIAAEAANPRWTDEALRAARDASGIGGTSQLGDFGLTEEQARMTNAHVRPDGGLDMTGVPPLFERGVTPGVEQMELGPAKPGAGMPACYPRDFGPRLSERTTPFEHETTAPAPEPEGLSFPVDISKSGDQTFPEPCGTSRADEEFLSGGPLGREPRPAR